MAFVLFVIDTATRMRNLSNTRWQHEATTKTSTVSGRKTVGSGYLDPDCGGDHDAGDAEI